MSNLLHRGRRPQHGVYPPPESLNEALATIDRVWALLPRFADAPGSEPFTVQLRGALEGRTR